MEAFAQIPSMTFLKANRSFSGSYKGMRWKIYFEDDGLKAVVWEEPYCFEQTADEKKVFEVFSGDVQGMHAAERWVEKQYYENTDKWVPLNHG